MWCSVQPFIAVLAYLCGTGKGIFSTTHTSILASSVILCWNKLGKHMFPTVTFFVFLCLLTMSSSESAGMFYLLFFFFFFPTLPSFLKTTIFYCSSKTDFQVLQWSPWYRPSHETAMRLLLFFQVQPPTTAIHLCENTLKPGGGLRCRVCNFHESGQKLWCLLIKGIRIVVEAHLPNLMCFFDLLSISRLAKTNCGVIPIFFEKRKERLFFSWNIWKAVLTLRS